MKYDERGFYVIEGASDMEDCSMFNGLIALFEYRNVNLSNFITKDYKRVYQRCPGSKYDFSRDQVVCLWAGLWKQQLYFAVDKKKITGKDLFSPANNGHYNWCRGLTNNWFNKLWLKAEILFHAKFKPIAEPNQLIAMMMVAGPEYLKLWTKHNKFWAHSIAKYWFLDDGAWRNEQAFGEHMINTIERIIYDRS